MSILVPVLDGVLLVAGRGCNVLAIFPVYLGANSQVLICRVECVRAAGIVTKFLWIPCWFLRRQQINWSSIIRGLRHNIPLLAFQVQLLILVIFLDLQSHSVVVEH